MDTVTPVSMTADLASRRWPAERAWAWHRGLPWLVGANFSPSTASNQLEMWQEDTFDPVTIDRELGWAAGLGMTSMRVFLHDLCWRDDARGFLERIDRFLAIAERHRIGALLVLLDSCWLPEPRSGRQEEPLPGVHNSRWLQSPGVAAVRDPARFADCQGYVQGVLDRFRHDRRIHGWDLWNEPDNHNHSKPFTHLDLGEGKPALVLPLLARTFAWAREVAPDQPLTSGIWRGDYALTRLTPFARLQIEASDIVSFHSYGDAQAMAGSILKLSAAGRPLWCTEYMARPMGSTFAAALPELARHQAGAWNWGLVDGRTQTKFPWESWEHPYQAEPQPWFSEVFRRDGTPYLAEEAALIRRLTAAAQPAAAQGASSAAAAAASGAQASRSPAGP